MPIQNVGTLLENVVITDASFALLALCREGTPLEFVNSFAMPPLSPWRPHSQTAGFDDATLDRVRDARDSELPPFASYARLLRTNLRSDRGQGPNAGLLVAAASLQAGVSCRMWLNDIRCGHYGDAIPQLEQIENLARTIYNIKEDNRVGLSVNVSDVAYPRSIKCLAETLRQWRSHAIARLGFLDPLRYRFHGRKEAETSSKDHREWLAAIAFKGLSCAVQFTANSNQNPDQFDSLERNLRSLHDDAIAEGYGASRVFQRQHYAVFLATRSLVPNEADRVVADIEARVQRTWDSWGRVFTSSRNWSLKIYRNGIASQ
jgi:hypothetical protein